MPAIKVTPNIARALVKEYFGDKFEFEIVGSVLTSEGPADDIDFIVRRHDFINRLKSRLCPPVNWTESDYHPNSSYKTVIDGITFNAVVLDPKDYKRWQWAAEAVKKGPKYVRPAFKSARVELWTWLVSIAPFSFDY